MHLFKLTNRKIQQGRGDMIVFNLDKETILPSGIIEREPIDLSKWRFSLKVHKGVEYRDCDQLFSIKGQMTSGTNGMVYFEVPDELTDIKPATYWYTVQYIKPNGKVYRTQSAKYIITESLNDYFSIYRK